MEDNKDITKGKIVTSEITETDLRKIQKDLRFIDLMTKLAKEKGCRLIVSGGYATDGNLGRITRPHSDIDIQIFGQSDQSEYLVKELIAEAKKDEPTLSEVEVRDKGRQEFYHSYFAEGNGLGSDIYYVQVTENPFDKEKHVVKKDGTITERQEYETTEVTLEGITFEAISPTPELVDKLYKREIRGDKPKAKHNQDIANLRLITDPKEVEARLARMKKDTTLIETLYAADIEERNHINWDDKNEVEVLRQRDRERKEKAMELIETGGLISGLDYHHASLILQHGETTEDYKLAHELAEKAVNLGDETAKWLYAATFDRWLLSSGKSQRYGTQFKQNKSGEWELALPIDPSITDEERIKYNVPPLSKALSVYKAKYNLK